MQVEEGLKPIEGYMLSLRRDTMNGWYEMEIGLPAGWIFRGNDYIECEVVNETKAGTLIKIYPKTEGVLVDDLISFVQLILSTNSKIAEKEKKATEKANKIERDKKLRASQKAEKLKALEKAE